MFSLLTVGSLTGFLASTLISHPKSPVARHRPKIGLLRIQLLPQVKIFYKKERAFVCHHWFLMLIMLFFSYLFLEQSVFISGFLVGGIGQGLTFRDRFSFKEESRLLAKQNQSS